ADLGDIAFFQEYETARHRKQGRDVRGDEVLLDSQPDYNGATLARQDQPFRVVLTDHGQRVRTLQFGDRRSHGLEEILHGLKVMMDAMRNDFRIRFGRELVAGALQLVPQFLVVLDDPVMNDSQTVAGDVGMRVALAGNSVRGPTGVGNADLAGCGALLESIIQ